MFTNEPCQLWSYWTEFHEIFTQYAGIIYVVNAHTFHFWISERRKWGVYHFGPADPETPV